MTDAALSAPRPTNVLALTRMELKAGLRSGGFRLLAILAAILGWSSGAVPGDGVGLSAYSTGEAAWLYMGFLAIAWMSMAAVRDSALRTDILVYSKPQPTERLVLSRFISAYGQIVAAVAAMFLGAILGRLIAFGGLAGFPAYGLQFGRVVCVLLFACSLSFTFALLANSALTGTLAGLVWVVTVAGKAYLAKAYFPSYTQNASFYILLSIALICVSMLMYRRRRKGKASSALWVSAALPISLAAAASVFWTNLRTGYDPLVRTQVVLDEFGQQVARANSRAPGFLLPDQYGKLTSLSHFPDSIFIIGLWSPQNQESALMLSHLKKLQARFTGRKVQPIAICLSEDSSAPATFAFGEGVTFPVVFDWGTHNAPKTYEISPMAEAYETEILPKIIITDRRRKIRQVIIGPEVYDGPEIEKAVDKRLAEEPE